MSHVPLTLIAFFLMTVILAFLLLVKATRASRVVIAGSTFWIWFQLTVAFSGFYLVTNTLPPRIMMGIVLPIFLIAGLFLTGAGRRFIERMDLKWSVLVHSIRIPVELTLYWLFLERQVPRLMTFEGGNIDMLAGLTAPIIWWAFSTGRIGRKGLLLWNGLALLSVLNALVRAMLSAPFRFQQFAFDQPTIAILRFPFILLPAFIVPVVLFCHLVIFRKLSGLTRPQ